MKERRERREGRGGGKGRGEWGIDRFVCECAVLSPHQLQEEGIWLDDKPLAGGQGIDHLSCLEVGLATEKGEGEGGHWYMRWQEWSLGLIWFLDRTYIKT